MYVCLHPPSVFAPAYSCFRVDEYIYANVHHSQCKFPFYLVAVRRLDGGLRHSTRRREAFRSSSPAPTTCSSWTRYANCYYARVYERGIAPSLLSSFGTSPVFFEANQRWPGGEDLSSLQLVRFRLGADFFCRGQLAESGRYVYPTALGKRLKPYIPSQ